jgi:hypothetical protein
MVGSGERAVLASFSFFARLLFNVVFSKCKAVQQFTIVRRAAVTLLSSPARFESRFLASTSLFAFLVFFFLSPPLSPLLVTRKGLLRLTTTSIDAQRFLETLFNFADFPPSPSFSSSFSSLNALRLPSIIRFLPQLDSE